MRTSVINLHSTGVVTMTARKIKCDCPLACIDFTDDEGKSDTGMFVDPALIDRYERACAAFNAVMVEKVPVEADANA